MSHITFWIVIQNLVVIVMVVLAYVGLSRFHQIFKWSWLSLFKSSYRQSSDEETRAANIYLMPLRVKYFGIVYGVLLFLNLPALAMQEEQLFRAHTDNWAEGLLISLAFGLAHCIVGVPIGAGFAITIAGVWFTHLFFIGGVEFSALHHTTYNLILVSTLLFGVILSHFAPKEEETTIQLP